MEEQRLVIPTVAPTVFMKLGTLRCFAHDIRWYSKPSEVLIIQTHGTTHYIGGTNEEAEKLLLVLDKHFFSNSNEFIKVK